MAMLVVPRHHRGSSHTWVVLLYPDPRRAGGELPRKPNPIPPLKPNPLPKPRPNPLGISFISFLSRCCLILFLASFSASLRTLHPQLLAPSQLCLASVLPKNPRKNGLISKQPLLHSKPSHSFKLAEGCPLAYTAEYCLRVNHLGTGNSVDSVIKQDR